MIEISNLFLSHPPFYRLFLSHLQYSPCSCHISTVLYAVQFLLPLTPNVPVSFSRLMFLYHSCSFDIVLSLQPLLSHLYPLSDTFLAPFPAASPVTSLRSVRYLPRTFPVFSSCLSLFLNTTKCFFTGSSGSVFLYARLLFNFLPYTVASFLCFLFLVLSRSCSSCPFCYLLLVLPRPCPSYLAYLLLVSYRLLPLSLLSYRNRVLSQPCTI